MTRTVPALVSQELSGYSAEANDKLHVFAALVEKWNPRINLVSAASLSQLWTRHMLDSAQMAGLLPDEVRSWVDLGTGGGFPGLVIAILLHDREADCRVTMVESDRRKATFLREAARILALDATVICDRIEATPPLRADVVSARALAPLAPLLGYAFRHLAPGGTGLFLKGSGVRSEIESARHDWTFDCEIRQSRSDAEGHILKITGLRHAE